MATKTPNNTPLNTGDVTKAIMATNRSTDKMWRNGHQNYSKLTSIQNMCMILGRSLNEDEYSFMSATEADDLFDIADLR